MSRKKCLYASFADSLSMFYWRSLEILDLQDSFSKAEIWFAFHKTPPKSNQVGDMYSLFLLHHTCQRNIIIQLLPSLLYSKIQTILVLQECMFSHSCRPRTYSTVSYLCFFSSNFWTLLIACLHSLGKPKILGDICRWISCFAYDSLHPSQKVYLSSKYFEVLIDEQLLI